MDEGKLMSIWGDDPSKDEWGTNVPEGADLGALSSSPEENESAQDTDFEEHPDGLGAGYPDVTMSVRVWLSAERRLAKIRISNAWRDRSRGTSLSNMIDQAFLFAYASVETLPELNTQLPTPDKKIDLTWDEIAKLADRVLAASTESDALGDQAEPSHWEGHSVQGTDPGHHVTVTLDLHGMTAAVNFDKVWLDKSRVSELCKAIEAAHRDAYRKYTPPTYVEGDHAKLVSTSASIQSDVNAMLASIA